MIRPPVKHKSFLSWRRTMKLKPAFLCAAFCVLLLASTRVTAALSEQQQAWLQKAERHEKHGWIYLHIEGSPQERGFQHGYLLAKEIAESLRARATVWHYTSGMEWSWLVEKSRELFTPKIDAENLAEIDGIVEGLR